MPHRGLPRNNVNYKLHFTGEMLLCALKRVCSEKQFSNIPKEYIREMQTEKDLYQTNNIYAVLKSIRSLHETSDNLISDILNLRDSEGSLQYLGVNACLDFLRPPRKSHGNERNYVTSHEILNEYATWIIEEMKSIGTNIVVTQYVVMWEMEKLARNMEFYELVPEEVDWLLPTSLSDNIQTDEVEVAQIVNSILEKSHWSAKNVALHVANFIFGDETYYLKGVFEAEFVRWFEKLPPALKFNELFKSIQQVMISRALTARKIGNIKSFTKRDGNSQPIVSHPIILRYFEPRLGNQYCFTSEVIEAVNKVHRSKGEKRKFSQHVWTIDNGNGIFHTISRIELGELLKNEGIAAEEIKLCRQELVSNSSGLPFPLQSPIYSTCVTAWTAIAEMMSFLVTDLLVGYSLPTDRMWRLREYIDFFCQFLSSNKKTLYCLDDSLFKYLMNEARHNIKPFLEDVVSIVSSMKQMKKMNIKNMLITNFDLFNKFSKFEEYLDVSLAGVECTKSGNYDELIETVTILAIFSDFPKLAKLVHNQNFCFHYGVCALDSETDEKRCVLPSFIDKLKSVSEKFRYAVGNVQNQKQLLQSSGNVIKEAVIGKKIGDTNFQDTQESKSETKVDSIDLDISKFCKRLKEYIEFILVFATDEAISMPDFQKIVTSVLDDSMTADDKACLNEIVCGKFENFLIFQKSFTDVFEMTIRGKEKKRYIRKKKLHTSAVSSSLNIQQPKTIDICPQPSSSTEFSHKESLSIDKPSSSYVVQENASLNHVYSPKIFRPNASCTQTPLLPSRKTIDASESGIRNEEVRSIDNDDDDDDDSLGDEMELPVLEKVVVVKQKSTYSADHYHSINSIFESCQENQSENFEMNSPMRKKNPETTNLLQNERPNWQNAYMYGRSGLKLSSKIFSKNLENTVRDMPVSNKIDTFQSSVANQHIEESNSIEINRSKIGQNSTASFNHEENQPECCLEVIEVDSFSVGVNDCAKNAVPVDDEVKNTIEKKDIIEVQTNEDLRSENIMVPSPRPLLSETNCNEDLIFDKPEFWSEEKAQNDVESCDLRRFDIDDSVVELEKQLKRSIEECKLLKEQMTVVEKTNEDLNSKCQEAFNINAKLANEKNELQNEWKILQDKCESLTERLNVEMFLNAEPTDSILEAESSVVEMFKKLGAYLKLLDENNPSIFMNNITESLILSSDEVIQIESIINQSTEFTTSIDALKHDIIKNILTLAKNPSCETLATLKQLRSDFTPFTTDNLCIIEKNYKLLEKKKEVQKKKIVETLEDCECLICKSDMETGEKKTTCEVCFRSYHATCVSEWLKRNSVCPVCRSHFPDPEEFPSLA